MVKWLSFLISNQELRVRVSYCAPKIMKDKDFEQQGEDHARAERILAAAKALEIERDPKELLKEERISIIANSVRGGMKE